MEVETGPAGDLPDPASVLRLESICCSLSLPYKLLNIFNSSSVFLSRMPVSRSPISHLAGFCPGCTHLADAYETSQLPPASYSGAHRFYEGYAK